MYQWGGKHVKADLGSIPLNMLERSDVGRWLNGLAAGGRLSRRSIQICRLVLRDALDDAVHMGVMRQRPAARVALPRKVAQPGRVREVKSWDHSQVLHFLDSSAEHPLGRAAPPRRALRVAPQRAAGAQVDDIDVAGGQFASTRASWTPARTSCRQPRRTLTLGARSPSMRSAAATSGPIGWLSTCV